MDEIKGSIYENYKRDARLYQGPEEKADPDHHPSFWDQHCRLSDRISDNTHEKQSAYHRGDSGMPSGRQIRCRNDYAAAIPVF